jgi:tetratricopeptide (TPR) repeat protein
VGSASVLEIRAAVDRAIDMSPEGIGWKGVAARILLLADDVFGARRVLAGAETEDREHDVLARAYMAGTLGDVPAAIALLCEILRPDSPIPWLLSGIDLAAQSGAAEYAVRWGRLVTEHQESTAADSLRVAELLLAGGCQDAAVSAVHAATLRDDFVPDVRAANILFSARATQEAEEVFRLVEPDKPVAAHRGLATIALWRRDVPEALAEIQQFIQAGGEETVARRDLAIADVLTNNYSRAKERLDSLGELPARDAETRVWRTEVLLRSGSLAEALVEARKAGDASPDHSHYIALRILEALGSLKMGRRPDGDIVLRRAVDAICGEEEGARFSQLVRRVFLGRRLAADRMMSVLSRLFRNCGIPFPTIDSPAVVEAILERALWQMGGKRDPVLPTVMSEETSLLMLNRPLVL